MHTSLTQWPLFKKQMSQYLKFLSLPTESVLNSMSPVIEISCCWCNNNKAPDSKLCRQYKLCAFVLPKKVLEFCDFSANVNFYLLVTNAGASIKVSHGIHTA